MRKWCALILALFIGCATGVSRDEFNNLQKELSSCKERLSAIEERQYLVEAKLDEALSKWDLFEKTVKSIKAFEQDSIVLKRKSPEMDLFKKAYVNWYGKRFYKAVNLFSEFIEKFDDPFLTPQAYLLIVDSYEKMGMKKRACLTLKAFFRRYSADSIFYCSAVFRLKELKCNFKIKKTFTCVR